MTDEVVLAPKVADLESLTAEQRELAVTGYLANARRELENAVTATDVVARKAEVATVAEATRQLGLNKEIQIDATELLRRAEYQLGKAIRAGQAAGTIAERGGDRSKSTDSTFASPSEFIPHSPERTDIYAMSDNVSPETFEAALNEAREEGNVSRANVVRKLAPEQRQPRAKRRALADDFFDAVFDLRKAVEKVEALTGDDRFKATRATLADVHASDFNLIQAALDRITASL